jgi:hypothetical protein
MEAGGGQNPIRVQPGKMRRSFRALDVDARHDDPVDFGGAGEQLLWLTLVELEMTVGVDPSHRRDGTRHAP